ncbi:putative amidase [Quercus suber]|uniref:Amidase n=1 Tax=Quercus suber TaxID=58331 RepID=A0AAW0KN36_QUESU
MYSSHFSSHLTAALFSFHQTLLSHSLLISPLAQLPELSPPVQALAAVPDCHCQSKTKPSLSKLKSLCVFLTLSSLPLPHRRWILVAVAAHASPLSPSQLTHRRSRRRSSRIPDRSSAVSAQIAAHASPLSRRSSRIAAQPPICRTVADVVYVLNAIVDIDHYDNATIEISQYIPKGGYAQFLKADGLRAKRVGIVRDPFYNFGNDTIATQTAEHLKTLRKQGTILVVNLEIVNIDKIHSPTSGDGTALATEFKISINAYLNELVTSPVRSLADLIDFNKKNSKLSDYGYVQLKLLNRTYMGGMWGGDDDVHIVDDDGVHKFRHDVHKFGDDDFDDDDI